MVSLRSHILQVAEWQIRRQLCCNAFSEALLNTQILLNPDGRTSCEVNQIDFLLDAYGLERGPKFQTMTLQDTGGTKKTVAHGLELIEEMLPEAATSKREPVSVSELTLALQCGGSDAYSGTTTTGAATLLVRNGGTRIG